MNSKHTSTLQPIIKGGGGGGGGGLPIRKEREINRFDFLLEETLFNQKCVIQCLG